MKHKKIFPCSVCSKTFQNQNLRNEHTNLHTCNQCNKQFMTPMYLRQHAKIHNRVNKGQERFPCGVCSKTFKDQNLRDEHVEGHTKPHTCDQCNKQFMTPGYLRQHAKIHNRVNKRQERFPCGVCGKTFTRNNVRNDHMKGHTKPHTCDLCNKQFMTSSILKSHIAYVHNRVSRNQETFPCEVCSKIFKSKKHRDEHFRGHTDPYKCDLCKKQFSISRNLKDHIIHVHIRETRYGCGICGITLSAMMGLKNHIKTIHSENRGGHKCLKCGKKYSSKPGLNSHMTRVHNRVREKCPKCAKAYKNLTKHINTVHNRNRERHECLTCGKMCFTMARLKEHMEIHKTDRDFFKCHHCLKCFVSKQGIVLHIRKRHNRERFCRQCNQNFNSKHEFNMHKVTHQYRCEHCDNVFKFKDRVKSHMNVHFPQQRVQCTLCTKTRKNKHALKEHMIDYHGVMGKNHKCDVCKKHFNSKTVITKHMASHFLRFKCQVCAKLFGYKNCLTDHVTRVHSSGPRVTNRYYCDDCTGSQNTKGDMLRHWLQYHNPKHKYKCKLCSFKYPTAQSLAGHYQCMGKEKKFTCTICRRMYTTRRNLQRHKRTMHA